jgi:hypothetical protein
MLQRTNRLRDALERQGGFTATGGINDYYTGGAAVPFVTEAEFVTPSGIFPSEFRWEALRSCYKIYTHRAPVDQERTHSVDVLWLSPTVFLSPLQISVQEEEGPVPRVFYDCAIDFLLREEENTEKSVVFRVYSLSSLLLEDRDEPSLLPFQFLQHVTALLPANYFSSIVLRRVVRAAQRCPSDHLLQFLAAVPNGPIQEATLGGRSTSVVLFGGGSITRDEFAAILSHPFHPSAKLEFDNWPFHDGLPMIEVLKDAQCLRSVKIPVQMSGGHVPANPVFELSAQSSNLMMHAVGLFSPNLLDAIATIHDLDDVRIESYLRDSADQQNVLNRSIVPFLTGCLKAKSLRVNLCSFPFGGHLPESQVKEWASTFAVQCASNALTMFNVWYYPDDEDQLQNLGGMKEWDAQIFPSLVLNYCGENLLRPLEDELLPSAIQFINKGSVYRKTTGHKAFDMRMANAGLIFAFLRNKAGETTQGHGFPVQEVL